MTNASQESVLGRLKTRRLELEANKTVDIEIPGWNGILFARYKSIPYETFKEVAGEEHESATDELVSAWRTLQGACDCILIRNDDGELEPLDDGAVRFDTRLARYTGDDLSQTPDEVIDNLFPNEPSVIAHHNQYVYWLSTGKAAVEADLGKVSATTDESA